MIRTPPNNALLLVDEVKVIIWLFVLAVVFGLAGAFSVFRLIRRDRDKR